MSRSHPAIVLSRRENRPAPPVEPRGQARPMHLELARQLDGLPRDLGVTLLVLGMVGVVIPGPIPPGFSFILMGVIALRPTMIERSGAPLARRFPKVFRILVGMVTRFRKDLARHYPDSVPELILHPSEHGPRPDPKTDSSHPGR